MQKKKKLKKVYSKRYVPIYFLLFYIATNASEFFTFEPKKISFVILKFVGTSQNTIHVLICDRVKEMIGTMIKVFIF